MGTSVATPRGIGVVARFDEATKLYTVTLGDRDVEVPRGEILIQTRTETPVGETPIGETPIDETPGSTSVGLLEKEEEKEEEDRKGGESEGLEDEAPVQVESDGAFGARG